MIDAAFMTRWNGFDYEQEADSGGQHLILPAIIGAFIHYEVEAVWIPRYAPHVLGACEMNHIETYTASLDEIGDRLIGIPWAAYIASPTFFGGEALFDLGPDDPITIDDERRSMRAFCNKAARAGAKIIVTGLGIGDVTIEDRLADMGGGRIIAKLDFHDHNGPFIDWVICREIDQ